MYSVHQSRPIYKMTCTSSSISSVISGSLGYNALENIWKSSSLLGGCKQIMKWWSQMQQKTISGLSDIRNPWFPSEYPTTSTCLLCGSATSLRRTSCPKDIVPWKLESETSYPGPGVCTLQASAFTPPCVQAILEGKIPCNVSL